MFERMTQRAGSVIVVAQQEARAPGHDRVDTEHMLLALLREQEGLAAQTLESVGVTSERVRQQVTRIVGTGERPSDGQIPFTVASKKVLELALREALALSHDYIGTEHILLGLLANNEGVAVRVLLDCEVDLYEFRDQLIVRAGGSYAPHGDAEISSGPGPAIDAGWLDGLPALLEPLGEEIRSELGRAPDLGDLLLALVCVPHTPAADAFAELGVDVDQLWGRIERARTRRQTDRQQLAKRLTEVTEAKQLAIERARFDDAAALRDQERELRGELRSIHWERLSTIAELRRRIGIAGTEVRDSRQR